MANTNSGSRSVGLGIVGLFLGGVIGFLLRPSAMLIGQLPFETVISRGENLQGLDKLLVATAQTSFNMMAVGAIIGAVVGVVLARMLTGRSGA